MNPKHRSDLPPAPPAVDRLPVDRGYPVPWFVHWLSPGQPEFRAMDGDKLRLAILDRRCWVCGERMTTNRVTFVIGPMCVVNRISAEPPSHRECAEYSVKACPFLSRPNMVRRENDLPSGTDQGAGMAIKRNPGVTCLWTTRNPGANLLRHNNGFLFQVWPSTQVSFWREGRAATRAEVLESVTSGLPILQKAAIQDGPAAVAELNKMVATASMYWPV